MPKKGQKHSVAARAKISAAGMGKSPSPATRAKLRAAMIGHVPSAQTREKLRAALTGRRFSAEHRAKISAALNGRQCSPEHRAKNSAAHKGKISPMRGKHQGAEWRAKNSAAHMGQPAWNKGKQQTPEARAKMSAAHKGLLTWMKGKRHTVAARTKMSLAQVRSIQAGRFHPERHSKGGFFYSKKNGRNLHYRSLLELGWYQVLEVQAKVNCYHVEPIIIPYIWEGTIHRYLPDLWVFYADGTAELIEVRPERRRDDARSVAKFAAAEAWCLEHGEVAGFRLVGYEELKQASAPA